MKNLQALVTVSAHARLKAKAAALNTNIGDVVSQLAEAHLPPPNDEPILKEAARG